MKFSKFRKYLEYFKIGFRESVEYKWEIFGSILSSSISIIFFIFVWSIIFDLNKTNFLNGFYFEEMVIYFIILYSFQILKISNLVYEFSEKIKKGDLVNYLAKPLNFIYSIFFKSLGTISIELLIYLVLMTGLIIYSIKSLTFSTILLFFIYSFCLFIFYILMKILISTLSFFLTEVWGLNEAIDQFIKIFSGKFFPLSFFPSWFINILMFTPFLYLEYQLTLIFLNKISFNEILFNLGILNFWNLILCFLIYLTYKSGVKKVNINGG
jgi:ABC-2 type transport system permease protein